MCCKLFDFVQNTLRYNEMLVHELFNHLDRLAVVKSLLVQLALERAEKFARWTQSQHSDQFLVRHG